MVILLFIPTAFCFCDLLFCILTRQRFPSFLRIIIDLVAFVIFPYLFILFMIPDTHNTGNILFSILCIICSISYFVTSYVDYSNKTVAKVINVLLAIGLFINFAIWITLISSDFELGVFIGSIGNLSIIFAIVSAVLYRYRLKEKT